MPQEELRRKVVIIGLVIVTVILVLLARLAYLQLDRGRYYAALAKDDYLRVLPIPAARGKIVDDKGRLVAGDRIAWTALYLHSQAPPPAEERLLEECLQMTPAELRDQLQKGMAENYSYAPIVLKSNLTLAEFSAIMVNRPELPGVRVAAEPARYYPYGELGAHILGYLGAIGPKHLAEYLKQGYQRTDLVGKAGLEKAYEPFLRGRDGAIEAIVDREGRLVRTYDTIEPKPGDTLHLTIDWPLEEVARSALLLDMKAIRDTPYKQIQSSEANEGAVIVLNVRNGDILAMTSWPPEDINNFQKPGTSEFNRAIQGRYEPGSIFKPFMAIAALAEGVITPTTRIFDPGYFPRDPQFKNWYHPGFGWLDLKTAIAYSDDVFFYYLGEWLHLDRMQKWMKLFGLNGKTGIDLPDEVASQMPTKAYLKKKEGITWTWGWDLNTVIGQGISRYTLIALARALAAIANGGTLYRPHLVSEITAPSGRVVVRVPPDVQGRVPAPRKDFEAVWQGMEASAQDPKGTGYGAMAGIPLSVATKTGTAQTGHGSNAFFVTFAPTQDPQIAVIVYIKHGVWGADSGWTARAIYDQYFHLADTQAQALFDRTFGLKWAWPFGVKPKATPPAAKRPAG